VHRPRLFAGRRIDLSLAGSVASPTIHRHARGTNPAAAGIATKLGNHSFRATGITAYLKNGGTLEKAAAMANHASTQTTQLYDRRRDEVSLDEVERIAI
jgi:integrase